MISLVPVIFLFDRIFHCWLSFILVFYNKQRTVKKKGGETVTIKEFAERKKVSKQAVYKSINRNGISAKQLTDRQGNLTKKGLNTLRKLFPDDSNLVDQAFSDEVFPDSDSRNNADQETEQLRQRVKELQTECEEWKQKYFQLVDSSREETQQLRVLIRNEQELRLRAEHKGFIKRLFAGKTERGNNNET